MNSNVTSKAATETGQSAASHPPVVVSDATLRVVLAMLSTVVFMAVVSGNMINVALPFIGTHFGASEATYGWIVTGYSLTFGIFNPIHGRLADLFGLKRIYILGLSIFGVTSLVLALSPSIEFAIGLRLVQGAGASAIPAMGATIVARLFPANRRGAAMGVIMAVVGLAASIGPFLGGFLVELGDWRLVFMVTAVVLLAIPAALRLLPEHLNRTDPKPFDVFGAGLLSLAVASLLYSMNVLKTSGLSLSFVGVVSLGTLGMFAFRAWIQRHPDPFVNADLFRNRPFVIAAAIAALANATRFGTVVLVPILLVKVNHLSPITVGLVLLPGALLIFLFSPIAGRWADRVGIRRPVSLGSATLLVGSLVSAYSAGRSVPGLAIGMGIYGIGWAFIAPPLLSAASQMLSARFQGVGIGIYMMIFFLGGAFGTAISVVVVDLQPELSRAWLWQTVNEGERFGNAVLVLAVLACLGAVLARRLPVRPQAPAD